MATAEGILEGKGKPSTRESLAVLENFFDREVIRGERIIAWTRLTLAIGGLINEVMMGGFPGADTATVDSKLTSLGLLMAAAYSIWALYSLQQATRQTDLRLFVSVTVDTLLICLVTSGDIVHPDPDYLGILREPGMALFLLAAVAAGARLSPRVAAVGAIVTLMGVGAMVTADMSLRADFVAYGTEEIILGLILLAGANLLGYAGASRTRNLVFRGAQFSVQAERTRQRFGVYVSEEVVERALKDDGTERAGRRQPVAVLFCDLRGFTGYAEKKAPEKLVLELNAYLDAMLTVVRHEGGWLDKYIGDAMMVVFGIGKPRSDDAARAIRAAAGMRQALLVHNAHRRKAGLPAFAHGIGIHHGSAIVGNIGTPERLQFTVVGDVVNLASRLEAATKEMEVPVLISSVAAHVARSGKNSDLPALRELGSRAVPGRSAPLDLFTLADGS